MGGSRGDQIGEEGSPSPTQLSYSRAEVEERRVSGSGRKDVV